jgi:predicted DNA repair protein MutK
MLGGTYLCYEGFEKIAHSFTKFLLQKDSEVAHKERRHQARLQPEVDLVKFVKDKIKGAMRRDLITHVRGRRYWLDQWRIISRTYDTIY